MRLSGCLAGLALSGALWAQQVTSSEIESLYDRSATLYVDLHRYPELAFQETVTAGKLAERLRSLGFVVTTGIGGTGVVGLLRNGAGPTVMMRTELDALPVEEKTGLPFASKVVVKNAAGESTPVMHACGHDLHMAAWSGTAEWFASHKGQWKGTLMMVGQPAEEVGGGAMAMLKDGLFTKFPKPDYALSLHDDDTMPAGVIGYHAGYFRASADFPTVTMFGRGGHGAMPQTTVDPVVLAARVVLGWQTIVARENNPLEPAVVTVGSIHGGTKNNIIPDQVKMQLSVRTFSPTVRAHVLESIARTAKGEAVAAAAPKEPLVEPTPGMASVEAVYNDPATTARLAAAVRSALGESGVMEMPPKMTSEDFSEYGRAGVKAVLLHIGAVDPAKLAKAKETGVPVPAPHSPQWAPDLSPTLRAALKAEIASLLALFQTTEPTASASSNR